MNRPAPERSSLLLFVLSLLVPLACGPPASGAGTPDVLEEHASFVVDGRERRATIVHPPQAAAAPPLLVVLHGVGGDGARIRAFTGGAFDRLAAEEGVLVAYPEAVAGVWNDCRATGESVARREGVDDVAFLAALVEFVRASAGGTLGGVFVTGYSNGGQMALRVAFEAPELVDAVAPFGALLPVAADRTCSSDGAPVPTLVVAGTADPICPFEGGPVRPPEGPARGDVLSAHASAAWLARRAGHTSTPTVRMLPDTDRQDGCRLVEHRWSSAGRPEVQLLEVRGGGHALPLVGGEFPPLVGPTAHDVDGARAIWSFCERQLAAARTAR